MQQRLVAGVKNAISADCIRAAEEQATAAIDEIIQKRVNDFIEDWMSSEVVLTNNYGEEVEKGSIKELVKKRFDDLMNSHVDSSGRFTTPSTYGSNKGVNTVVGFLTGAAVKEVVESELRGYKNQIDEKIKSEINNGIKNNVSDLFARMVVNTAQENFRDAQAIESKSAN